MTHDEFMLMYDKSLRHGWVTSRDSNKAAQQKQREKEYNAQYYQKHKDKWLSKQKEGWEYNGTVKSKSGTDVDVYGRKGDFIGNAKSKLDIAVTNAGLDKASREQNAKDGWEYNGTVGNTKLYGNGKNKVSNTLTKANLVIDNLMENSGTRYKMDKAKNRVQRTLDKLSRKLKGPDVSHVTSSTEKRTYVNGHLMSSQKGNYTEELLKDYAKAKSKSDKKKR